MPYSHSNAKLPSMKQIVKAIPARGYRISLTFDDGISGVVDLSNFVDHGVFSAWKDYEFFERVHINSSGSLEWPGDLDLCADALYLRLTEQKPIDIFTSLQKPPVHA